MAITPGIASASDGVDRHDGAVSDLAAHVGDVGGAGEQRLVHVVDVGAADGEELRIFLAENTIAENAAAHAEPPELRCLDALTLLMSQVAAPSPPSCQGELPAPRVGNLGRRDRPMNSIRKLIAPRP